MRTTLYEKPIVQLRSVTSHMRSHSVTWIGECDLPQPTPAEQDGLDLLGELR